MRRAGRRLSLSLLFLALLSGAAPAEETEGRLPDASRVVAIGGSVTEIVYALGEGDRLVARDSTSTFPEEALKLPDVGYMRQLSPEGVLSVTPSAILALEGSGPKEAVDALMAAEVPFVTVPESFDREGILRKIEVIGTALGADARAAELKARVGGELEAAEKKAAGIAGRKRVLFILSAQEGRIMASGMGTAADGIIRLAGGENAIDSFSGYRQLTPEAILTADPDFILMMERGGGHVGGEDAILSDPAIASTRAGRDRRVLSMDGSYLLGFGPRTAAAATELAAALYGAD